IFAWLGVAKIGGAIALINTNLRGKPLEHSYRVSGASLHIIGAEHCSAISPSLMEEMGESSKWFRFEGHSYRFLRHSPNETSNEISNEATTMMTLVDPLLEQESTTAPTKELRKTVGMESTLFLIYTSGTTGPPKAARCPHIRFGIVSIFPEMCGINHKDRLYCPLPLYHSAGGIIGVGSCWYTGATLVLRRKFSRTHFWEDISKHECTAFQYIGELCRYLLAAPEGPYDKQHNVKWAVGNGLRPDIWEKFQQRFNIQNIGEFYAATEGNVGFFNPYNKVGAVGYLSPLLRLAYPAKIVRFDHETEMPYRDPKTGFCVECKDGEEGELLGLIKANDPSRKFAGYTDSKATEKKVLRDVFVKGDMYFRSGDLLKFDSEGYVYFVDRIGDTFRWKGENVATTEVAAVIGGFEGVAETNVYGVRVGNADGKAGMALIIPLEGATIDLDKFYNFVMAELPSYAAPLFLRLRDSGQMDTTSTFKHKKADLVNEGFNPDLVNNDKLYYRDDRKKAYVPVSRALYQDITQQHLSAKL
ncbi:Long-chain-acyl-CoA synthetase, partial [Balamuthia mandrillaris]